MKVYHFTEQPYPDAWKEPTADRCGVNLPNRKCDPRKSRRICCTGTMTNGCSRTSWATTSCSNEHHQTTTCMSSTVIVRGSRCWRAADQAARAAFLSSGIRSGHRGGPACGVAEGALQTSMSSSARAGSIWGFIKGVPYEFAASNQNPVGVMDRFLGKRTIFILKAMTTHDGARSTGRASISIIAR